MSTSAPTPDEQAQAAQLTSAAVAAAAEAQAQGADREAQVQAATDAVRDQGTQMGLDSEQVDQLVASMKEALLSDDVVARFATAMTDESMQRMAAMGAFDPAPAPAPAADRDAEPAAAETASESASTAAPAAEPEPPRRQSWAERHGFA